MLIIEVYIKYIAFLSVIIYAYVSSIIYMSSAFDIRHIVKFKHNQNKQGDDYANKKESTNFPIDATVI